MRVTKFWVWIFLPVHFILHPVKIIAQDLFPLVSKNSTSLYISETEYPGVMIASKNLREDIERVTGKKPELHVNNNFSEKTLILIGTIGKNKSIDQLIESKKLDVTKVKGKWEAYVIQVIENPFPTVDRALVIAGSDKRGTIFGIYEVSKQIGVSPWYWWADVPVKKQAELYFPTNRITSQPTIKYRGIFINDEAPALSGWATQKFGGFNHKFYEKVFELILRLKGNYLWPAMWGRAIYDDDSLSASLANNYGVVIGTSHHEPMMRAHVEWQRYGKGEWNYEKNEKVLQEFWRKGIERMGSNESTITLGMRGDGDMAMSKETNVALLEQIIKDQRAIIQSVTKKPEDSFPQVWALYKEVQDYYDEGMRVPDDVTLLLCDDNWGNIRKLPKLSEPSRKGGYGIYYHFDYVGGPRNYKWLNTNQIERVWEQMNLAYAYGATTLWIVNVGDIKPMEFPIEFFLDMAWSPEGFNPASLQHYTKRWAQRTFGEKFSDEITFIISTYTKFNSRRKPELINPETYSLTNYREAEKIVDEYNQLVVRSEKIYNSIEPEYKDAFYQLVLFPVKASANLNELYVTSGKNRLYAKQGRAITNDLTNRVSDLFNKDAALSQYYNDSLANGKWSHMMDQTHIGYSTWQQPEKNKMPDVTRIELKSKPEMGVAIEGSELWWPQETNKAVLPTFDAWSKQSYSIEIFNRGPGSFKYSIKSPSWINLSSSKGSIDKQKRIEISIDWGKAPKGNSETSISIKGSGKNVTVFILVKNTIDSQAIGFMESNGYISIEAEHYSRAMNPPGLNWETIPNLGKTLSAVSLFPVTHPELTAQSTEAHLEYDVFFQRQGEIKIYVFFSPTLDFHNKGLRYAISIDDEKPQVINLHENRNNQWPKWVANNIIIKSSNHNIDKPGKHILKFWALDAGIVLQKIVVDTGGVKESYLGPPESVCMNCSSKK